MIQLSDSGLERIEKAAEKSKSTNTLLLVCLIREVRKLHSLLNENDDAGHGSDNGTDSTNNRDGRHE